ncbi:MAG: 23S rRNA (adenine(2503)-C(2))-methyltransferase RlmN [bacterium]
MDTARLKEILDQRGLPAYRRRQIERDVYVRLISGWDEATGLPAELRELLVERVPLSTVEEVGSGESRRGDSSKVVLRLTDGELVESVLMRHDDGRNTVCVSSQAGCPMRCAFCATGRGGFRRNLTADEIVDQVLQFARPLKKSERRVSNVVFMGMGEPFHNYDAVLAAARTLNAESGLGIAARRISISTCGLVPGIERLAAEPLQLNLAISLHAPDDETRRRIMPVNDAYPIGALLAAVRAYVARTRRKVMFEYLLLDGINDSPEQADLLASLLGDDPLFHVNLIRFHRTGDFRPTPKSRRDDFLLRLKSRGISVTHRVSFGEDIQAACGMLAADNTDRDKKKDRS